MESDTHKEQIGILGFACGHDSSVGSNNFCLNDMVKSGSPHARRRTKATLQAYKYGPGLVRTSAVTHNGRVSADADSRANTVRKRAVALLIVE